MNKSCAVFFFVLGLWRVASCLRMSAGVNAHAIRLAIHSDLVAKPTACIMAGQPLDTLGALAFCITS